MEKQLIDEDKTGELYTTAISLLKEEEPERLQTIQECQLESMGPALPISTDYAILEKVVTDERSHKVLLQVLVGRLCSPAEEK